MNKLTNLMKNPTIRLYRFLGAICLAAAFSLTSIIQSEPAQSKVLSPIRNLANVSQKGRCPSDTPLRCGGDWCCAKGYTLHCPRSTCRYVKDGYNGCYNPDRLTDEQLAELRNCCPELSSCRPEP